MMLSQNVASDYELLKLVGKLGGVMCCTQLVMWAQMTDSGTERSARVPDKIHEMLLPG